MLNLTRVGRSLAITDSASLRISSVSLHPVRAPDSYSGFVSMGLLFISTYKFWIF